MPNARKPKNGAGAKPRADIAASYNAVKNSQGRRYTGMRVGRGHTWNYDAGQSGGGQSLDDHATALTVPRSGIPAQNAGEIPSGTLSFQGLGRF